MRDIDLEVNEKMEERIMCILCGEKYPREITYLFHKLEHFKDLCMCNKCIAQDYLSGKPKLLDFGDGGLAKEDSTII